MIEGSVEQGLQLPITVCDAASAALAQICPAHWEGRVVSASAPVAEIRGMARHLSLGDRVRVHIPGKSPALSELISLRRDAAQALMYVPSQGLRIGALATAPVDAASPGLPVSDAWLGRVIDPLGVPLDGGPPLLNGPFLRPIRSLPPEATRRARLGPRLSLGVRALDLFTTSCDGQRLGLFAGAGVGKSTLLSMLARNAACDLSVICLVGERGREVREFLEDDLGEAGLARSVVIISTSDSSPLMRREAAFAAMTVAEHFRDHGHKVLFLMDSVTRFCQALREIALAAGETPVSRGYPPSVFTELPRLLERAGPGESEIAGEGKITAFFTVLVDGDDHTEPIADAMRGLLDGHVVLDRRIAERGRFPAVDVARSLSRTVPACNSEAENQIAVRARTILSTYAEVSDMLRLGAYRVGSDETVDEALRLAPKIESLLNQGRQESTAIRESFAMLAQLINVPR